MRKHASLMALLMLFCALAFAQTRTISGQVKDSKGDPVPFANISIKGTNTGVAADINGNFKIDVKPGESLIVSSASFAEQEVKIGEGSTLTVTLQSQGNLQEVVVTALGIRRTRNQTPYAAQQLQGDEVSKARSSNFVQNLSGKVAGLDVKQTNTLGGSTNVVLRGTKSITGDNQALFVVDGVPYNNANTNTANQRTGRGGYDYGNSAADINPDDIATVTVLKGAAASALYGSQGANGVILITTKKGVKGLGITVNSGISVGKVDKSTFAKYQKVYGAGYGAFYEDPSGYFLYRDIDGDGTPDLVAPFLEDASYGGPFDPTKMVYQWDSFDPLSPNFGKAKPWIGAVNDPTSFFETPVSSNQSIFVDGGSDRGSFKLGYTRNDDAGILPNSSIKKNLVNFSGTYNITPKLTAGSVVNFSNIAGVGRFGTGYDDKNLMTNFRQWWETNIDIKDQKAAYFRNRQNVTWNWKDPDNLIPNFWDNPYFTRYENYENDSRNRYFGNVSLNYKITDWLNILGRISLDSYDELQEERQAVGSVTTSSYSRFNRAYRETNYDLLANLDKDLSSDINFKALVGFNLRRQHTESIRAITNGGLIIPKWYALANSLNTPNAPVEADGTREVQGVFAGATFTWRDMVTLDATIRRDKSSTLPEANNVYYYPSVSAGFVFSKLLPTATWLSYGKLRANYAQVGNDAPIFSVYDTYGVIPVFGPNPQFTVAGTKNNPDLVPERTRSAEVGLEMAFIKNRVGFDFSYYNAKTIDQIIPVIVSTATGYNSKFLNAGTIQNKGIELSVFGSPVQTKDFAWNINVNFARNRNKVVALFEGAQNLVLADFQSGVSINATLGQPYGTIRGSNYVYTNDAKGTPQRTVSQSTGRYLISSNANEVIGNANPDWAGGISNSLRYKDLTLSFLIDTRQGGDIFSLDMFYGLGTGLYPETVLLNDLGNPSRGPVTAGANSGGIIFPGVAPDGSPNTIRRANSEGTLGYRQPAAVAIYDASYIKLREVAISYALPKTFVSKLKYFKGIDLSLTGRNLWIIDKNIPYADPEESISSGNLQGYQSGAYPTTRTFTLNAKFRL
jgi:TonB-linked SusC/RagA family outer membrane protein